MNTPANDPANTPQTTPLPTPQTTPQTTPLPDASFTQHAPDAPSPSPSFLQRHAVGVGITAAVLAVVVVAGGTAWGVSAAVAGEQTSASTHLTAQNASHTMKKHGSTASKHKAHGAVGSITAMSGDTWTMHAASGATVTVKLSSSTAYGTKKTPSTQSTFAVGDRIGALGTRSGDTVTATRIVHLPVRAHTATPAPTATPST